VTLYKTVANADGTSSQVEMSAEEEADIRALWAASEAPKVPHLVSGQAGRAIMKFHDLHDTILAYIAAIPDLKTRLLAEQGYLTAATFSRNDTLLNAVFAGMGKTDAERDAYFIEADELSRTV
jgi:hypothetical protein